MKKKDDYYLHLLQCTNELISNVDKSFHRFIKYVSSVNSSFEAFQSHQKKSYNQLTSSGIPSQFLHHRNRIDKVLTEFSDLLYTKNFSAEISNFEDKHFVFMQNVNIQMKLLVQELSDLNAGIQTMIRVAQDSVRNDSRDFEFHNCLFDFIKHFREKSSESKEILENIMIKSKQAYSEISKSCDQIMRVLINKIPTKKESKNEENPSIQKVTAAMADVLSIDYVLKKIIMPFSVPNGNNELVNYFQLESDLSRVQPAKIKENCTAFDAEMHEVELEAKLPVDITTAGYSHFWEVRSDNVKYFVPSEYISI